VKRTVAALLLTAWAGLATAATLAPIDEASYPKLVASQKGKVLLVNFWATWCVPCRAEMPQLVKMQERLKTKGFTLITISADEPEQEAQAAQFLQKNGVPAPTYLRKAKDDDKFINSIDPKWSGALPALVLYDRTGKKVKMYVGESNLTEVEAAISKLL
jgi:thiol-disulfide isomerase/thioredoxin